MRRVILFVSSLIFLSAVSASDLFILPQSAPFALLNLNASAAVGSQFAGDAKPIPAPTFFFIRERNPVVNEGGDINLTPIDKNGREVIDVVFSSDSPDIAEVDPLTGVVHGKRRGFANIIARRGNMRVLTIVAVARVEKGFGIRSPGDVKVDLDGSIYLCDPFGNVILRKREFADPIELFSGTVGVSDMKDGRRRNALFSGPSALAVGFGNSQGLYIADAFNHCIRKIDRRGIVTTIFGAGLPGTMTGDATPFDQAFFNGPRGIALDRDGNLLIADTENHAVYLADFAKRRVLLLAGDPGKSGREDGRGRSVRFNRPMGIAVSPDGTVIAVADSGNNRVRIITREGDVFTAPDGLNKVRMNPFSAASKILSNDYWFDEPQSVSFDEVGNIYVVDRLEVNIITAAPGVNPQISSLAQYGSFKRPSSVTTSGGVTLVLDAGADGDGDSLKAVTFGAPEITGLNIKPGLLGEAEEVAVEGENFAPESLVMLDDEIVVETVVLSSKRIVLRVPAKIILRAKTLIVKTRGGTAEHQVKLSVIDTGEDS